ncbi:MAG: hypothetical protein A3G25_04625 [Betaproteobacteria bacterium RIFCSPLOWO2_12_FULL_63_13]|nr:MAG: hypothetical protein A3H32_10200 [Betaproteobacteria bacterium RIFCSPLOWO2_02_FULL_63_19]OGA45529.1 MAG: hypothetical protein A3G25_04625 [Betaproteobacteria bacterium RIFCSPLOWO2_12_FULL_63_13]
MPRKTHLIILPALLILGACATYAPTGPSAMVLPGTGKSFDQFRADDMECRQYAALQSGGTSQEQAAVDSTVKSAALGTAVGAVAGAAMGGRDGAGVGAGMGLIAGTLAGSGTGNASAYDMQRRYDFGYQQCMYAKGHRIPVNGRFSPPAYVSPPAAAVPPPPPPGSPPPPPPR